MYNTGPLIILECYMLLVSPLHWEQPLKISKQRRISFLPPLANNIRIYYIFPPSSKIHLVTIQPDIVSRLCSAASGHGRGKQQCIRSLSSLQARQWWGQGGIFGFRRRGVKEPECDLQLPLRIRLGTADPLKAPTAGTCWCTEGVRMHRTKHPTFILFLFQSSCTKNESKA